jgi:hypothetical protein
MQLVVSEVLDEVVVPCFRVLLPRGTGGGGVEHEVLGLAVAFALCP